jgi:type II secretory pathway pseudopilin PulG
MDACDRPTRTSALAWRACKRAWQPHARPAVLIEVMIGAVVLSIATVGLLNGLDGAQGTNGRNTARSVAAALAEQDQERMRSMSVTSLPGYTATRTVAVRGVDYTVVSNGSWAVDSGGPISCSNTSRTAANVRIVSTVSSPATRGTVDQASLVSPPPGTYATGQGRAIVKVSNPNQAPVSGMTVNLTGPGSFTGTTNSLGCAVFPFIPIGTYTAAVSGLGYVDWDGNLNPTKSVGVTQSASTAQSFEMGSAAEIRATFDTVVGATTLAAESRWLTVSNSKMLVGSKLFTAPTASPDPEPQLNATNLFPFLDGYSLYPGQCSVNAAGAKTYTPTPGQILTVASPNKLRLPAINIRVVTSNSTSGSGPVGLPGATVVIKSADAGCGNTFPNQTSATTTAGGQGALPAPGFPYGSYKVCAQQTVGGVTTHGHADVQPYASSSTAHTDETVVNTAAGGNTLSYNTAGAIRVWIKPALTGPCH